MEALSTHTRYEQIGQPGENTQTCSDSSAESERGSKPSWRRSFKIAQIVAAVTLLLNLSLIIAGYFRTKSETDSNDVIDSGNLNLFEGTCTTTTWLGRLADLFINALSTALISSSFICAQVLLSPTVKELEAAHEKGQHFSIGIPSLRNSRLVPWWRSIAALMLLATSMPLHVLLARPCLIVHAHTNRVPLQL